MQVVLIGGHALVRGGLRLIIAAHWPSARIVEASDFGHLESLLAVPGGPDLVLVDIDSLDSDWPEAVDALQRRYRHARVVVLASTVTADEVRKALRLGAAGYVPKGTSVESFVDALRNVLGDRAQEPPLTRFGPADEGGWPSAVVPEARLTPRQREILPLIAEGYSNKEIARRLGISEGTVKLHMRGLFRVLGVRNRAQAVAAAGLGPMPEN